ncbi:type VI secretion system protein TssA [Pseudomonas sp. NPDC089401]|uniref:type VI secretion system protein TssA n=1 Tax=Pseudomonas sp. NPDC089401 TaxID=3364462 RepID=UPI00381E1E0B
MHLCDHLAALTDALSAASPCGENLEYDADFLALEYAAQGTPDVEYGATLTEAVAPDWKRVHSLALALGRRSRDLRLAMYLTRAELHLHGVAGLAAGLALIEVLLAEHWQHVHPQLDPDEDNDPQLRINSLAGLCDGVGLLRDLRATPLVEVAGLGRASLRDIDQGSDDPRRAGEQDMALIEAMFQQAGHGPLAATLAWLEQACQASRRIEALLTEQVGCSRALDLSALTSLLQRGAGCLRQRLPQLPATLPAEAALASVAGAAPRGPIDSREDVRQALDQLCRYFAVHEPGSPVPLLLQRAGKLLDLNFIELLQDLAPDGLAQMAQVSGIRSDD